ncbi:MAG: DUF6282 family protein [Dehalococcoidia bacterium]
MADQVTVQGLLKGAFDLHVHSSPDVLPRKFDDLELAKRTIASGMAGFVLKSHYICTADRAALIRGLFPEVQAFGGLALNNSVGGLNPIAVDIAGRLGNKVVWLPSVDSANELENVAGQLDESKLPYWMPIARELRAIGIAQEWIRVTDEDGAVTPITRQCLEVVARHDMVLATSHVSPKELTAVVRAAHEAGVRRIIVTHPEFPTTYLSIEQHKELLPYGVMFERCFTTWFTGKVSWEQVVENIRTVGPSSTVLSTDLGQTTNPYVDEGMALYIDKLLDAGFSESELEQMVRHNPARVLGATTPATV